MSMVCICLCRLISMKPTNWNHLWNTDQNNKYSEGKGKKMKILRNLKLKYHLFLCEKKKKTRQKYLIKIWRNNPKLNLDSSWPLMASFYGYPHFSSSNTVYEGIMKKETKKKKTCKRQQMRRIKATCRCFHFYFHFGNINRQKLLKKSTLQIFKKMFPIKN